MRLFRQLAPGDWESVIDVAPTLAYLLGIPVPHGPEGGVVYEAQEERDWHRRVIDELKKSH